MTDTDEPNASNSTGSVRAGRALYQARSAPTTTLAATTGLKAGAEAYAARARTRKNVWEAN